MGLAVDGTNLKRLQLLFKPNQIKLNHVTAETATRCVEMAVPGYCSRQYLVASCYLLCIIRLLPEIPNSNGKNDLSWLFC